MTKHTRRSPEQSLRCLHEESAVSYLPSERAFDQIGWDVRADLSHRSTKKQHCSFCHNEIIKHT